MWGARGKGIRPLLRPTPPHRHSGAFAGMTVRVIGGYSKLMRSGMFLRALLQPLVYRRRHFTLRAAGHVNPDVAALERQLGVIFRTQVTTQRT